MKKYLICDLDGTLCDITHRRHFMEQPKKDWESFFKNIDKDKLNNAVHFLLSQLTETDIIFVTGRMEKYREVTEKWLKRYGYTQPLFMRKDGDYRQDYEVKEELYREIIHPLYGKPQFVLDDRDQVVNMWRSLDIDCFQVNYGSF